MTIGALGDETLLWHRSFYYADPNSRGFGWEQIAATYDGFRPAGMSAIKIECYEGGLENCAPSQGQCRAVGLDGATYGTTAGSSKSGYLANGTGGAVFDLLQAYKSSALAKQLVIDQFTQFKSYPHSVTPAWYALQGPSQWSLSSGSTLVSPFKLFDGFSSFASGLK
jgi:hypothetical protein